MAPQDGGAEIGCQGRFGRLCTCDGFVRELQNHCLLFDYPGDFQAIVKKWQSMMV